jgi:2-keto-3-deoxy-L-rhamnonate aldolase RhmA
MPDTASLSFRQRLVAREPLFGSFVKTPTSHPIEILGGVGYDFVVVDQEHGAFDRTTTDIALLAARAAGLAGVVRVPALQADAILSVLDCGAAGVLVPHIASAEAARTLAAACRYRGGARGYSGVTRAGGYGATKMWDLVAEADAGVAVVAMIEDPPALSVIDDILAVDGLDAVFIGRGDLTVSLGAPNRDAPVVREAVDTILRAAARARKPVCMMIDGADEARDFTSRGASAFIVSSDQGFLRKAAAQALGELKAVAAAPAGD